MIEEYRKYEDIILKIVKFPLCENITMEKLSLTRAQTQALYRSMKRNGFCKSVVDYVHWINAKYVIRLFAEMKRMKMEITPEKFREISPANLNILVRTFMMDPVMFYKDEEFQVLFPDRNQVFELLSKLWHEMVLEEAGIKSD